MHLLMEYDNRRKSVYGEINTMLNTSTYMDQQRVIDFFRDRIDRAADYEQKYTITYNLIAQAHAELSKKKQDGADTQTQQPE